MICTYYGYYMIGHNTSHNDFKRLYIHNIVRIFNTTTTTYIHTLRAKYAHTSF